MLLVITLFILTATVVTGQTTAADGSCVYNGVTYPQGQFRPSPCSPCACYNGVVHCAVVDCALAPCVDAVKNEDHCCAVCPNGPNCRTPDGTIIPAGQSVEVQPGTHCRCPHQTGGFGFFMTPYSTAFCDHTVVDIGGK